MIENVQYLSRKWVLKQGKRSSVVQPNDSLFEIGFFEYLHQPFRECFKLGCGYLDHLMNRNLCILILAVFRALLVIFFWELQYYELLLVLAFVLGATLLTCSIASALANRFPSPGHRFIWIQHDT